MVVCEGIVECQVPGPLGFVVVVLSVSNILALLLPAGAVLLELFLAEHIRFHATAVQGYWFEELSDVESNSPSLLIAYAEVVPLAVA